MTTMVMASPEIVLLVNGGEIKNSIALTDAIRLLYLGKVEILEAHDGLFIRSSSGVDVWPMPKILQLIRTVALNREKIYGPRMVSKRGVLDRDNRICAYCGVAHANTVDHVVPRSKGGESSWLNLVAACRDCNNRKRNRTPEEAGMPLTVKPYAPKRKIAEFLS